MASMVIPVGLGACGSGGQAGSDGGGSDATVMGDATPGRVDGGADTSVVTDGSASSDGRGAEASATDGGPEDGGDGDAHEAPAEAGDASEPPADAADAGCAPPTPLTTACGAASCEYATEYCLFGSVPNKCLALPPECQCGETHTCACLLAHAAVCDGGIKSCTPYADGGELWLAWIDCH